MVNTQAMTIRLAIPQFTADIRLDSPTPRIAEVMTWVVLVGIPMADAPRMTPADAVSTQKPCTGWSLTKSRPTVFMMRQPPAAVPKAMATAQATFTQVGTSKVAR
jgi:hypothetical protein